jgi:hypothetical protein
MIRIDEIYCNTFLPLIQARPDQSMHWFDPFGSVDFADLVNLQAVSSAMPNNPMMPNHNVVRFLFWDQEPLHQETVDQTLSKFKKIYSTGQAHIVTSEYNSSNVEYIQHTYGFKPHYYFFHGWAALDWFRGYNHSFLITPPDRRHIIKTFIAPNRIVAGQRQHRLLMLYHIFKAGMTNNWISCPKICPAENIKLIDAVESLTSVYPDIQQVFAQQTLPINFPNETGHPMHSARLDLFAESAESLLYLVTETVATGCRQHLTEKTFKPIALRMPFIIVGCAGSLNYLQKYGFRTFAELWDESYDTEVNDLKRYEKIAGVLKELDNCTSLEKQHIFDSAQEICEHNYRHFYHGGFEHILWQEVTEMINGF